MLDGTPDGQANVDAEFYIFMHHCHDIYTKATERAIRYEEAWRDENEGKDEMSAANEGAREEEGSEDGWDTRTLQRQM